MMHGLFIAILLIIGIIFNLIGVSAVAVNPPQGVRRQWGMIILMIVAGQAALIMSAML